MKPSLNILVTGGAGFIGSNLNERLLDLGYRITCIDNFDDYYPIDVKHKNLQNLLKDKSFKFCNIDIRDYKQLTSKLSDKYDVIIHLAAKAGVRPSILYPMEYINTNIIGTQNILEFAKTNGIRKVIFASSSSVYGLNPKLPWKEDYDTLKPVSPYAATKISGELLGRVYSELYNIQFLSLRFFTVYGPRQRPDLAIFKFSKMILEGIPVTIYGNGQSKRDYTYIDDIVKGIVGAIHYNDSNYEIFNLGNNCPTSLVSIIEMIENIVGRKAIKKYLPTQEGDVFITYADIEKARQLLEYDPKVKIESGILLFYDWLKSTYKY